MKSNKYMITTLNEYLNESDLLYRSGDVIKKSEIANNMTSNRNTGHFGTGFYFFGNKESADKYDTREVNIVDASKYNLLKIKTFNQGILLHDILKKINNLRYKSYVEGLVYSFVSEFELPYFEYKNKLNFESFDKWIINNEQVIGFLKDEISINDVEPFNNNKKLTNEVLRIYKNGFDKQKIKLDTDVMYLIDQLLSILKELYVNIKPFNKEKIYNCIINYQPVNDSLSTIILKYFGFEGVYVKGVDGLDNETFGSVIYDIK